MNALPKLLVRQGNCAIVAAMPNSPAPSLETALAEIDDAVESDSTERALQLSEVAIGAFPNEIKVLNRRAEVLAFAGEVDEACEVYRRALELAPKDLDTLLAASELLIQGFDGDHDAAEEALGLLERAQKLTRRDQTRLVDLHLLAALAWENLGEPRRALEAVERALSLAPDDLEVLTERGIVLFELCRLDDAKAQFQAVLRAEPEAAWPHHYLGLIAEHQRDPATAEHCFAAARRLAPEELREPIKVSEAEFERAVERALEQLPPKVRDYLANVAIIVEDLPDLDELRASEPPLSPGSLGMFRGTPITEQSNADPWSQFPSAILLFQRNLQRFAHDRAELVEQIGITLVHEVGHFLGLDEEELYDRGLD